MSVSMGWARPARQMCTLVERTLDWRPARGLAAIPGVRPLVRGRPPGRLLGGRSRLIFTHGRDEGVPRGPGVRPEDPTNSRQCGIGL
jgi:hypothetical protein